MIGVVFYAPFPPNFKDFYHLSFSCPDDVEHSVLRNIEVFRDGFIAFGILCPGLGEYTFCAREEGE